jgi:hypothetical protein
MILLTEPQSYFHYCTGPDGLHPSITDLTVRRVLSFSSEFASTLVSNGPSAR